MRPGEYTNPNAIGVGAAVPILLLPGFTTIMASTEAHIPQSGMLRVYWRILPGAKTVNGSIPRVRIGWTVQVKSMSIVNNFSYICDAWWGNIVINATSVSIMAGWLDDDIPRGEYKIDASIFDLPGGGAEQFAALTLPVALTPGPAPVPVQVPPQVTHMRWFDAAASNIEIISSNQAGVAVERVVTGAPVAGAPAGPLLFPITPEVAGGTLIVRNLSGAAVPDGRLTFYFFGAKQ